MKETRENKPIVNIRNETEIIIVSSKKMMIKEENDTSYLNYTNEAKHSLKDTNPPN